MKQNLYLLLIAILFAGVALLFESLGPAIRIVLLILAGGSLICYLVLKYKYKLALKKKARELAIKRAEEEKNKPKKQNYNQKNKVD